MAKVIVWGPDRDAAIARMRRALGEYQVVGVQTTIPILQRIVAHPDFVAGRLSTGFMERLLPPDRPGGAGRHRKVALIAAAPPPHHRPGPPAPLAPPPPSPRWRPALPPGSGGRGRSTATTAA